MPHIDFATLVNVAWLVSAGGGSLLVGLFALSWSGARIGPIDVRVSDSVFGGLLLAVVVPAAILGGFGIYILHARTGYYATPDDFRNSATFVGICWFFIDVVAPVLSLLGLAMLGSAALRRWHAHRQGVRMRIHRDVQAVSPSYRHRDADRR